MPGYRLGPPLGFGANGPVWSGTASGPPAGAGTPVALTILPGLADSARAAARRRRLETLPGVGHPSLVRTLDVLHLPGGQDVVVTERVDGPTLVALRAARAPFTRAEMAGVLAGLGRALETLHGAGVIHGDVSPANVVVGPGGSPVLLDLTGEAGFEAGTTGFRPPEVQSGGPASRAGDVWSAAATVLWMSSPADRVAVEAILGPALHPGPAERCAADHLAVLVSGLGEPGRLATPAVPVLAGGAVRARAALEPTRVAGGRTRRRARRPEGLRARRRESTRATWAPRLGGGFRVRRRLRASVAVLSGVLAGAVIAGLAVSGGPGAARAAPYPAAGAVPGIEDGREALIGEVRALLSARDEAIVRLDRAELAQVTVPGSPAAQADAELLAALQAAGIGLTGLRTQADAVDVRRFDTATAEVAVVTTQRSYVRRTAGGDEVVPQQAAGCVLLGLDLLDGGWRVRQTQECPDPVS